MEEIVQLSDYDRLRLIYPGLGLIHGITHDFDRDVLICNKCKHEMPRGELISLLLSEEYRELQKAADNHRAVCDKQTSP